MERGTDTVETKGEAMSRYIDAIWAMDRIPYEEVIARTLIANAPHIDIVRCKECKYCVDAGAQRALVCDNSYIDMDIHPDDFCSYGERKEDE